MIAHVAMESLLRGLGNCGVCTGLRFAQDFDGEFGGLGAIHTGHLSPEDAAKGAFA